MTIFNYFEVVKLIILSLEMSILVTKEFRIFKLGLSSMVMVTSELIMWFGEMVQYDFNLGLVPLFVSSLSQHC